MVQPSSIGEVAGDRLQGVGELHRVADGVVRQHLAHHRAQEVLLPGDPVEVAVEQAVAHPDVLQGELVLQVHPALVPLLVLLGVVDGLGDVDVDAADRGREVAEAGEVDDRHVVEPQAAEVLDVRQVPNGPYAENASLTLFLPCGSPLSS